MKVEYDVIILGGGCAGLALASRLAEFGRDCPKTLLVEKRKTYSNDRTWCFWDDGDRRSQALAQQQWRKMRVTSAQKSVELSCGSTPYLMVAASDYYDQARATIQECSRIEFLTGIDIPRRLVQQSGQWLVDTNRAPIVIDTRPKIAPKAGDSTLWQSFYGTEIETEEDVFDPSCLDLMDFSSSTPNRILFTYYLPISSRRALIEVTHFGAEPEDAIRLLKDHELAIQRRVAKARFKVIRREEGILPMGIHATSPSPDAKYIYAGLSAGGARPCTGYAYQRIQRWAGICAHSLRDCALPRSHPADPIWLQAMDHLFLTVLRSRPDLAPSLFLSLFENTKTDRIIRFLSDLGQPADYADVISALPMVPFLKEIPGAFLSKAMEWQESWAS